MAALDLAIQHPARRIAPKIGIRHGLRKTPIDGNAERQRKGGQYGSE